MNTLEILQGARDTIAAGKWTKGSFARDVNGKVCEYGSAVSYCASGAMDQYGWDESEEARMFFAATVGVGYLDISLWNDAPERILSEVIFAFDVAIAAWSAKELN